MKNLRLILVDDNPEILEIVSQLLDSEFSIVGLYRDGKSLLQYGTKLSPDIIVLDVSLEDTCGFEIARKLRDSGSTAHILFLTVHEDEQFVRAGYEAGASGYVIKRRINSDLIPAIHAIEHNEIFTSNTAE